MFSALRKRLTREDAAAGSVTATGRLPVGVTTMDASLQRKFARGIQYNMKVVIRGDRNVGKTSLWRRLQGLQFSDEYSVTEEMQVCSVHWNYKTTDDVVKVDVWDVVDKSKKRRKHVTSLKFDNEEAADDDLMDDAAHDADYIDVYKDTHGVILMFDITKPWSWEYCVQQVPRVPAHIPILLLANRIDMTHHRQVPADMCTYFAETVKRPDAEVGRMAGCVRYAESSMRNGFGLKLIYLFFNVPFLLLQRQSLLKQLDTNELHFDVTYAELDSFEQSDECNYEHFMDGLTNQRREAAEQVAPKATVKMPVTEVTDATQQPSPATIDRATNQSKSVSPVVEAVRSITKSTTPIRGSIPVLSKVDVHNFEPDMTQDAEQFLESPTGAGPSNMPQSPSANHQPQTDSDEEQHNSMVTHFQEDIDSEPEPAQPKPPIVPSPVKAPSPSPISSPVLVVQRPVSEDLEDEPSVSAVQVTVEEDGCSPAVSPVGSPLPMSSPVQPEPVPESPEPGAVVSPTQITANDLDNFFGFAQQPSSVKPKPSSKRLKSPRVSAVHDGSSSDDDMPNVLVAPVHELDTDSDHSPPPITPPPQLKIKEKEKKKKKKSSTKSSSERKSSKSKKSGKEQLPNILVDTNTDKDPLDTFYEAF